MGRPPFELERMQHIHLTLQWFGLSDVAMEEVLHDVLMFLKFGSLDMGVDDLSDELPSCAFATY